MRRRRADLRVGDEAGMTLIELLVAAAMSVIVVGAAGSMLISAVRSQPQLSEKTQSISTARWALERMTREIRNGDKVYGASGSEVAIRTQVRRTACGSGVQENPSIAAIECRVTYSCGVSSPPTTPTTYSCTRAETAPTVPAGISTPRTLLIGGLTTSNVFNYTPPTEPTFVGITLNIANPESPGKLTVTDGAGLRILSYAG